MGPCRVRLQGETIYHDVVFFDDDMPAQIGFVTLGEYGMQADPDGEPRLVPMELTLPSLWPVDPA
jgi:hypothetical protein